MNIQEELIKSGINKEELEEKIKEKQKKYHDLLTEGAAARIIASEKGIKKEKEEATTPLSNLAVGNRITNYFKITNFYEPKTFSKNDRNGLYICIGLKNEEKEFAFILWNQDARDLLASDLNVNDCVKLSQAIVKNVNPLEIHCDLLTKIEKTNECNFSNREVKKIELKDISESEELIAVEAFVTSVGEIKKFAKEKREGKLCRATLTNGKNEVQLVCWGEYAEILKEIENNSKILLTDVKVKRNKLSNSLEIHSSNTTRIIDKREKLKIETKEKTINELKNGDAAIINCKLKELKEIKAIQLCEKCFTVNKGQKCQCGGTASETIVAEAILKDETGEVNCSFFDRRALQLLEMKAISSDIASTVCELKKGQIKDKKLKLLINTKFNNFLNKITANCKQLL